MMSEGESRSSAIKKLIPALGLPEYWYPAILARKVRKKPTGLKIMGTDLVFFRGKDGQVVAASNTCPHRGGSLMHGDCHYAGTVACPYHGWVFDEHGECLAVLSEGPESAMPGKVKLRIYPAQEHKGLVFVWMGEGEPVPIAEDVPPEFFEGPETGLFISARDWAVNWRVSLENSLDSHVMYVHRNALLQLMEPIQQFGRKGYYPRVVNGKSAVGFLKDPQRTGREYYPGVDGYWPKTEWRNLWLWVFSWRNGRIKKSSPFMEDDPEWGMHTKIDGKYVRSAGHHLPSMFRFDFGGQMYTRFCVPVTEDLTRVFYIHASRRKSRIGRALRATYYHLFRNWALNINFSTQDYRVMATQDYDAPETLSTSDSQLVVWRKLLLTARGMPEIPRSPPADASGDLDNVRTGNFSARGGGGE
jgi:nitrite reductase/ring-hydroxylating ferredoxin subunit